MGTRGKKYKGTFYDREAFKILNNELIDEYSKLYYKEANGRESLVKAIKAAKLPAVVKPLVEKIIDLETQKAALYRSSAGLNIATWGGTPMSQEDVRRSKELSNKFKIVNDELFHKLYPQVRVKLNLPSAAREKD